MNRDQLRRILVPAVIGLILLTALAYGVWGWLSSHRQQEESRSALESQSQRYRDLIQVGEGEPFPSPQNVALLRENRKQMELLSEKLRTVAARPVAIDSLTPDKFAGRLAQSLRRLHQMARDKSIGLPGRFAFGFEAYMGRLAPPAEVPLLTKQLVITETLCTNLFSHGIKSLNGFQSGPTQRSLGRLFQRTPFTLQFTCETPNLQQFINDLQTLAWLVSVRSLRIESNPAPVLASVTNAPPAAPPMITPPWSGYFPPMPTSTRPFRPGQLTESIQPLAPSGLQPDESPLLEEPPRNILIVTLQVDLLELISETDSTSQSP